MKKGRLIIVLHRLEISLRVQTRGTSLGRLGTGMNITAITALPLDGLATFKHGAILQMSQHLKVTRLMHLFHFGDMFERIGHFIEALFTSHTRKCGI